MRALSQATYHDNLLDCVDYTKKETNENDLSPHIIPPINSKLNLNNKYGHNKIYTPEQIFN